MVVPLKGRDIEHPNVVETWAIVKIRGIRLPACDNDLISVLYEPKFDATNRIFASARPGESFCGCPKLRFEVES